jgi:hypothetical protein
MWRECNRQGCGTMPAALGVVRSAPAYIHGHLPLFCCLSDAGTNVDVETKTETNIHHLWLSEVKLSKGYRILRLPRRNGLCRAYSNANEASTTDVNVTDSQHHTPPHLSTTTASPSTKYSFQSAIFVAQRSKSHMVAHSCNCRLCNVVY